MENNTDIISSNAINTCLSLFDEQFTIADFSASLEKTEAASDSIFISACTAIKRAFQNDEDDAKYVVDMSDEIKAAIEKGETKLITGKEGEIYAQLRNPNGQFGKRLPIKKELAKEGVSVEELQTALQMEVIKEQLQTIIEGLKEIEGRVTEVIQGQRNDRIGLFYSGLSLYIESRDITDVFLKKQLIAQALKSISDANSQMIQDIRTSIKYLFAEQYKQDKNVTEKIDEHLTIIQQCYDVVYRASFLKAAIYQENGEITAMLTAIDEYGRFVEQMIVPYVGRLSELDKSAKLIDKSVWSTIAHSLVGCRELKQQICGNNTYILHMGEIADGER